MQQIRVLVLTAVAALFVCPAWSAELAGYWSFDENQGTVAKTSAISGYDGEIHGAKWVSGKAGSALAFNGESDYVEIKDTAKNSPFAITSMSISAWIKADAYPQPTPIRVAGIAGKGYYTESTYGLRLGNDGKLWFMAYGPFGEGGKIASFDCNGTKVNQISLGKWHHVVVTYDNTNLKFYLDGKLDASYKVNRLPGINTQSIFIGSTSAKNRYFKGIIDEVKIYKGAITGADVEDEYKKGGGSARLDSGNLPKISEAPSLDGALSDSCWEKALKVDLTDTVTGNTPKAATTGYMCYDDKNLYIAFQCKEPFMNRIKAKVTEKGGNVWKDDCVEAFIDPGLSRKNFYHFMVNSKNIQADEKWSGLVEEENWDGEWQSATSLQPDGWTAEMKIPLSNFAMASDVASTWGINLCRERKTEPENTSWAPTLGRFCSPDKFGTVRKFDADFTPYKVEVSAPELTCIFKNDKPFLQLTQSFINSSNKSKQVNVKIRNISGKEGISRDMVLLPGKAQEIILPVSVKKDGGLCLFRTEISDSTDAGITYNVVRAAQCAPLIQSYFDRAYYTSEGNANLVGSVNIEGKLISNLSINVVLRSKDKTVGKKTARISDTRFSIPVAISRLPAGEYDANVSILHGDDALYTESVHLTKYPPANYTVNADTKNSCTLANGKPFFPIGVLSIPEVAIQEYADAGFNITREIPADTAYYNGMMTVSSAYYAVPRAYYTSLSPDALENEIRNKSFLPVAIKKYKDHPSMAGYFWDEPAQEEIKGAEVLSKVTRELDPYHAIMPCFFNNVGPTIPSTLYDISIADLYWFAAPHSKKYIRYNTLQRYAQISENEIHKPFWHMPATAGWDAQSAITPAEQRIQTYLGLIYGAKGVFYWSYLQMYPAMAVELKKLGRELKELSPVLLTQSPKQTVSGAESTEVHALAKMYNGDCYLLTANNSADEERTMRIKVSSAGAAKSAKVLFEDRTVPVKDGAIEDKFAPYATHVYVLPKADTKRPVQIAIEKLTSTNVPMPKIRRWPDIDMLDEAMFNPGFEDAEDGQPRIWNSSCGWETPEYCSLSTEEFHDGSKSLKLSMPKPTRYTPATGFGWSTESRVSAFDLGKLRSTCRYGNNVSNGLFKVDLPNGKYSVKVMSNTSELFEMKGDTRQPITAKITEMPVPKGIMNTIKENTFDVTVEGGQFGLFIPSGAIYSITITSKSGGAMQAFDFGPVDTPVSAGHKLVSASELTSISIMSRNNNWDPIIRLKPDGKYKLSIYMKSDTPNLPVTFGLWVGEKSSKKQDCRTVNIGGEWQRYEMPVTIKGTCAWSLIEMNASGTLWVDDFTLEKN